MAFINIIDALSNTRLNYQIILLDKPIIELETYGVVKVYEDKLNSRSNNHNRTNQRIVGDVIISKGYYNIENDKLTIYGSNINSYIQNLSLYTDINTFQNQLKNTRYVLVIAFDIQEIPKRSLLDKICRKKDKAWQVIYDNDDRWWE